MVFFPSVSLMTSASIIAPTHVHCVGLPQYFASITLPVYISLTAAVLFWVDVPQMLARYQSML
jgi:hypothetical protein